MDMLHDLHTICICGEHSHFMNTQACMCTHAHIYSIVITWLSQSLQGIISRFHETQSLERGKDMTLWVRYKECYDVKWNYSLVSLRRDSLCSKYRVGGGQHLEVLQNYRTGHYFKDVHGSYTWPTWPNTLLDTKILYLTKTKTKQGSWSSRGHFEFIRDANSDAFINDLTTYSFKGKSFKLI